MNTFLYAYHNVLQAATTLYVFSRFIILGVQFYTPETYFKGVKENAFEMPEFDPKSVLKVTQLLDPPTTTLISTSQEVIVMVGFPGSGKSYFSKHHLTGYEYINRDTLGSWQKCVAK